MSVCRALQLCHIHNASSARRGFNYCRAPAVRSVTRGKLVAFCSSTMGSTTTGCRPARSRRCRASAARGRCWSAPSAVACCPCPTSPCAPARPPQACTCRQMARVSRVRLSTCLSCPHTARSGTARVVTGSSSSEMAVHPLPCLVLPCASCPRPLLGECHVWPRLAMPCLDFLQVRPPTA